MVSDSTHTQYINLFNSCRHQCRNKVNAANPYNGFKMLNRDKTYVQKGDDVLKLWFNWQNISTVFLKLLFEFQCDLIWLLSFLLIVNDLSELWEYSTNLTMVLCYQVLSSNWRHLTRYQRTFSRYCKLNNRITTKASLQVFSSDWRQIHLMSYC